ncbi:Glycosyltransferase involved in cell wall bisynthesis [Cyclobacterium lianum]|uniref:Glycosyltransferase involved in cell wall bisynthesis n=1 Tax=Cyclobacterium lianum TaxID=388280 RepID=A0A1M7IM95_9BACT|nr:glycosyltransferase family 2 protein [Cyclobacterium lianum]SHM41821.1 Glycosyltransferase involved in cell wall bisynthesis [Cyclobacterium lianum]
MVRLSIITINFNNALGLRETIESIVNQTFTGFEYIVIDGGSTDGSVEVIREYADKITYWVSEPDRGIYNAMNKGVVKAEGEYLQFLNSGDCLVNGQILEKVFSNNYIEDILYGDANNVFEDGTFEVRVAGNEEEITLAYLIKFGLSHQASFFRRDLFSSGLYDEKLKIVSDWKFFIEKIVFENCSIKKLGFATIDFEMSGISNQVSQFNSQNDEREKALNQLLPERIARDYQDFLLISGSPLLKHMTFLNGRNRLHNLSASIVGFAISIYKLFKPKNKK